ncbi:MAG TPA: IS1595 family transposase [Candidatus Aquilonibacter sp.]|nr:IS1595 family transposase [Candidatus Aquilonibacter sp.]
MKDELKFPETLQQAIKYFSDDERAFEYMKSVRWPSGKVSCPRCGCEQVSFISTRKLWTCSKCKTKKQFTIRVGTILEDSAISFDKWICAFWLIANAKNGVSSYEIHRALGVTQKTGWFMLQRIRLAMQSGTIEKLKGEVEADETYIGGKVRNMHVDRKRKRGRGTGGVGKAIVMGLLERKGKIKLKHVANAKRMTVQGEIRQHVAAGSHVFTDALPSYNGLNKDFVHEAIDHAKEYVRGNVHTNGLENFWCLLKRCFKGTYVSVEPFHLFRYLDEQAFRFNERQNTDKGRFEKVISGIFGKRLTYSQLIGKNADARLLPA